MKKTITLLGMLLAFFATAGGAAVLLNNCHTVFRTRVG